MKLRAYITGCAGPVLTEEEKSVFRELPPCGLILFDRNCQDPDQIRNLIASFKEAVGEQTVLILIDQEGGRVQRLKPKAESANWQDLAGAGSWRQWPTGRSYGELYHKDAAQGLEATKLVYQLLSSELLALGINVNCVPVLDIPVEGSHDIIGDRAYGTDIETVVTLGKVAAQAHLSQGVLPVIKHVPGHGRANADSHYELPVLHTDLDILKTVDFMPFKLLNDLPLAMTAHVLIPSLDKDQPVSTSKTIMKDIIRDWIGYDGLVMSDDLYMEALSGSMDQRAKAVLEAGCDVGLYCKGILEQIKQTGEMSPVLAGDALRRFESSTALLGKADEFDRDKADYYVKLLTGIE